MCLLLLRFVVCFVTFVMFVMCYMPVSLPTSPSYGGMPWEGLLHHIEAMEDLYVAIRAAETARGIQGNALHLSGFRGNVNVICMQRRVALWRHGPLFHLKSCPFYPMRHATRAMARFLSQVGSFSNLAKLADDSSHELRIL